MVCRPTANSWHPKQHCKHLVPVSAQNPRHVRMTLHCPLRAFLQGETVAYASCCSLCYEINAAAGDPSDVEPQATEPLFPQEHQQPSCKGCHVGSPQLFVTDPPQPVSSLSSSTGSDTSDACPSSPTYADSCALQQLNTEQEATLATAAASERHITQATGLPDVVSNDALALTEVCEVRTPQEMSAAEGTLAGPAAWTPQGAVCHRQAGLKVLIKLHGQGKDSQLLGSWGLDQEQCNSKQV